MKKTSTPDHIVAIGASAGGLEALQQLLRNLPELKKTAIIIAQHLSPTHKSHLVDLLSRVTKLTVLEAKNGLKLSSNHIYITPPDAEISVEKQKIILKKPESSIGPKPSVDVLFQSISKIPDIKITAIILSGTGKDGAEGLKVLDKNRSFIMVQDLASAKYDGMPASALDTGLVDTILTPDKMGEEILRFVENGLTAKKNKPEEEHKNEGQFEKILEVLSNRTGTDFTHYKRATLLRRLEKRMQQLKIRDIDSYLSYLKKHPDEVSIMFNMILIGVTQFFRDSEAFDALKNALKKVLDDKGEDESIRIWVPGCSTGEEAYSISMILDMLSAEKPQRNIQIFATDIDERAIQFARLGKYTKDSLKGLPEEIISRYFKKNGKYYEVDKFLRSRVLFSKHDLTQHPPFLRLDLISCRNLLIYFDIKLQQYVLPVFHYALEPGGLLFLGKSETVGQFTALFSTLDSVSKIYKRKAGKSIHEVRFSAFRPKIFKPQRTAPTVSDYETTLEQQIKETLFKTYENPFVIIDSEYEIKEVFGDVRLFVSLKPGNIQVNLINMVNPELKIELRRLLAEISLNGQNVRGEIKKFNLYEKDYFVRLSVRIIPSDADSSGLYMVIFEQLDIEKFITKSESRSTSHSANVEIQDLERELEATKEQLQTYIEELETSNEELQSLNEELQSTNEELQSSNEELETTNEELQSSNEEIQITYAELKETHEVLAKKEELLKTEQAYSRALLSNTLQGFVLIDNNYQVLDYNSRANEILGRISKHAVRKRSQFLDSVPEKDVAEMLITFKECFKGSKEHVEDVILLKTLDEQDLWLSFSVNPVINSNGKVVSLAIGLLDITSQKIYQKELESLNRRQETLLNAQTHYVLRTDMEGRHTYWNQIFEEDYGWLYKDGKIDGTDSLISISGHDHHKAFKAVEECVAEPGKVVKVELDKPAKEGGVRTTLWEFMCLTDENGQPSEMQCMGIEITLLKELRKSETQFRTLFDDAPVSILVHDRETGEILDANGIAWKSYGFDSLKELKENDFWLEPPYSFKEAKEKMDEAVREGYTQFEWKSKNVNGEVFWELVTLRPITINEEEQILSVAIDITEKKAIEESLKDNELQLLNTNSLLEYVIEHTNSAVAILDDKLHFVYVSERFKKDFQVQDETIIGRHHYDVFPDLPQKWRDVHARALKGEVLHADADPYVRDSGEELFTRWECRPWYKSGDQIGGIVLYTAVITDEILRERELKKLSTAVTQNPASVVITDIDGTIEYVNPKFSELTGYTQEEAIGKNPRILKSGFQPKALYEKLWDTISNGKIWRGELLNKKKNGEYYWEFATMAPIFGKDGIIKNYLAIKQDISEQKKSQKEAERFKAIAEESEFGLAVANLQGEIIYINNFFARIHGFEPEALKGKHLSIFHTEEQMERVQMLHNQLFNDGYYQPAEVEHVNQAGHTFSMLMSGVLLKDEFGEPEFIAASGRTTRNV